MPEKEVNNEQIKDALYKKGYKKDNVDAAKMPPNTIWWLILLVTFSGVKNHPIIKQSKHAIHFSGWFLTKQ